MKLVMDRLVSVRKDRPINIDLPDIKTAENLAQAAATITEAIRVGNLRPGEGEQLSKILDNHRRAVETTELEKRLTALEARSNQK